MDSKKSIKTKLAVLRKAQNQQPMLFAQVADCLVQLNQLKAASKVIAKGLQQFPNYSSGWLVKGDLHLAEKQFKKARMSFKHALELDPVIPYAHEKCLELAEEENDTNDFLVHLRALAKLDPLDNTLQTRLHTALLRQVAVENGIYRWEQVRNIMPNALRQTLLTHNLLPPELERGTRRWSPKSPEIDETEPEVFETDDSLAFEEIKDTPDNFPLDDRLSHLTLKSSAESKLKAEELDSPADYRPTTEPDRLLPDESTEDLESLGEDNSDWIGAKPSKTVNGLEAEEEEEPHLSHKRVSWAETLSGKTSSPLIEIEPESELEEPPEETVLSGKEKVSPRVMKVEPESARDTLKPEPYTQPPKSQLKPQLTKTAPEDLIAQKWKTLKWAEPPAKLSSPPPGEFKEDMFDISTESASTDLRIPEKSKPEPAATVESKDQIQLTERTESIPNEEYISDAKPEELPDDFPKEEVKPRPDWGSIVIDRGQPDIESEPSIPASSLKSSSAAALEKDSNGATEYKIKTRRLVIERAEPSINETASEVTEPPNLVKTQLTASDIKPEIVPPTARQDAIKRLLSSGLTPRAETPEVKRSTAESEAEILKFRLGAQVPPSMSEPPEVSEKAEAKPSPAQKPRINLESALDIIQERPEQAEEPVQAEVKPSESLAAPDSPLAQLAQEVTGIKAQASPAAAAPVEGLKPQRIATKTLAELYASQSDWKRAVEVYAELLQKHPANEAYKQRLKDLTAKLEASQTSS